MRQEINLKIINILVLIACITKRAQIPFSSWLPAAIAAPTPVSALVHSSTLVTAGVYLLIRFSPIINYSNLNQFLLLIGSLTIFISGIGANFEFDLKKIIALSTLRQLGLIIIILSIGLRKLAFFHLLTHAIFKAILFICAGSIIHRFFNSQDIRIIGNLIINIPLTSSFFNIANLSLCGIPFLAGFYSKDLILESLLISNFNILIFIICFFSTGLTVTYSIRITFYSLTGDLNSISLNYINEKENKIILKRKTILLISSIIIGSLLSWIIFPSPILILLPKKLKLITLITCLIGGLSGYYLANPYLISINKSFLFNKNLSLIRSIWFLPYLSTYFLIKTPLLIRNSLYKIIDKGWSEYFGSNMLFYYLIYFSNLYQLIQSNSIKIYLFRIISWFSLTLIIII